ncbi:unnamed protein product [Caenorhabditis bovis]|uniref:DUF7774 domain-containing protein n=1 Tax=Caenorhabditis bovis TaxID=2654633 RepID=A0A8S1F2L7_9PELO|nr:unnamed protein product [Caenorhabditis bovis]
MVNEKNEKASSNSDEIKGKHKFWLLNKNLNKSNQKKSKRKNRWALTPDKAQKEPPSPSTIPPSPKPDAKTPESFADGREMRQKYLNVPKTRSAVEEEGAEVFEAVQDAQPVFATTLIRPGKMRWKSDLEKEEKEDAGSGSGRGSVTGSTTKIEKPCSVEVTKTTPRKSKVRTKADMNAHDDEEDNPKSVKMKKAAESADANKAESDTKIPVKEKEKLDDDKSAKLLMRIERLERENVDLRKKLNEVQVLLKKRKLALMMSSGIREERSRDLSEDITKLAERTLVIMKKNQILDKALDEKSNRILHNFFRECEKPTEKIASLVEEAITRGLKYMINYGDRIDEVIDNEMRTFICDMNIAKKSILRAMFDHPELVPDMWGGGPMLAKIRKEKDADKGGQSAGQVENLKAVFNRKPESELEIQPTMETKKIDLATTESQIHIDSALAAAPSVSVPLALKSHGDKPIEPKSATPPPVATKLAQVVPESERSEKSGCGIDIAEPPKIVTEADVAKAMAMMKSGKNKKDGEKDETKKDESKKDGGKKKEDAKKDEPKKDEEKKDEAKKQAENDKKAEAK